jgi:ATP-dependent helicase/DNAse subunit B
LSKFLSTLEAMEMGEALAPSGPMELSEFLARLRLLTSSEGFHEADDNRNAVQVSGLRDSYLVRYDYVFIIGMVDGDIPYLAATNAFIREREAVRMGLLSMNDLLRHERFYFLSALLSSNVRTYVSRPETNGKDVLVPSCFFDDLERAFDMSTFGEGGKESSSRCCQNIVGETLSRKRDPKQVDVDLPISLEEICQRAYVECQERVYDYDGPYDGVFVDEGCITELNALLAKRDVYSPSRLERYARCPFQYYLSYVMGMQPREEIETQLTPQEKGTLFHRIACRFYSELREQGVTRFTSADLDEMTSRIIAIGQEECGRYSYQGPAWDAFRNNLLGTTGRKGMLRAFLENETKNMSTLCPTFFELSFGLPIDDDADPSSVPEPVEIDLGGEVLKLRCRIDRVDACPDGRFVVIDYKTGSSAPSVASIEKGTALQLPLYIQAVEKALPEMRGIGGAYYGVRSEADIGHKGVFGDIDHIDELRPYFGERRKYKGGFSEMIQRSNISISSYLNGMRAGRFHPNKGPAKCPRGCEYAAVCRVDPSRMEGDDDAQ